MVPEKNLWPPGTPRVETCEDREKIVTVLFQLQSSPMAIVVVVAVVMNRFRAAIIASSGI